jgi:diguanylate cyclase (GGDEF)-like protein
MVAVEPLLIILAAAALTLVVTAALLTSALLGRGPMYRRFLDRSRHQTRSEQDGPAAYVLPSQPSVRFLVRQLRSAQRGDDATRRLPRSDDAELDDVLRGGFAVEIYNRAVRVLAWSSIVIALLVVLASELWQPVWPQIFATLVVAGAIVLLIQELIPPGKLMAVRVITEGSATIVFLTVIVVLTGCATSPFFFLYPLLVGGAALIATPRITLILTLESVVAYAVAAFADPANSATSRDTLARVAVNVTALILLAYSGMVIARVQLRTREAAIRLSTTDSLTDLHNRAYFFNSLDHDIQRGQRYGRGFCLLMMDLDGLKTINDRYGHYQGDLILKGVAQRIRAGLRAIDVAARYGGDEFVALLPETDPSGAFVVAEKIRRTVSEFSIDSNGFEITTSLSIGVVSYPDDGVTADELMIAADEAMYTSKRLGKNRVVGYAEPGDLPPSAPQSHRQQPVVPGFTPLQRPGVEPQAGEDEPT